MSRCDEQIKATGLIRPRGDVMNTLGTEWRRLKYMQKLDINIKLQKMQYSMGL